MDETDPWPGSLASGPNWKYVYTSIYWLKKITHFILLRWAYSFLKKYLFGTCSGPFYPQIVLTGYWLPTWLEAIVCCGWIVLIFTIHYFTVSVSLFSPLHRPYRRFTPRGRCHSNLVVPACTTHVEFQVSGSLWNCRSAANKAEFISAYATLQSLDLALTETWITTGNTATPTALSSSAHVFSHWSAGWWHWDPHLC